MNELFIVMADRNRRYTGYLTRSKNEDDNEECCYGSVVVDEGKMLSMAKSEKELANNLDDICRLKLDYGLHNKIGKFDIILGVEFNFN